MKKKSFIKLVSAAVSMQIICTSSVPNVVFGAGQPALEQQPFQALPIGGIKELAPKEAQYFTECENSAASSENISIAAAVPEFYSYSSDYGRAYLAENRPPEYLSCYDALADQCIAFAGNYTDVEPVQVQYSNGTSAQIYYMPKEAGRSYTYSLNSSQLYEVIIALRADHPEFYWLENFDYSYSNTRTEYTVRLIISSEYASGYTREQLDSLIESNVDAYVQAAKAYRATSEYMAAKKVHDDIARSVCYAYDAAGNPSDENFAHSIVGVFDDDISTMPVCEGYAKAYQLILNALEIENIYVTGIAYTGSGSGGHAWNMIRLDDGEYYLFDVTWDDTDYGITYDYFAKGAAGFTEHAPDLPSGVGNEFLYGLPENPNDDFNAVPIINTALVNNIPIAHSGSSGQNINWTIYENGLLCISGQGSMDEFNYDYSANTFDAPWYEYASEINFLLIDRGITSISEGAFWRCNSLIYVVLPDTLVNIGGYAFGNDWSIKAVSIPVSVTEIGNSAFDNCVQFTDIYYGGTAEQWNGVRKSNASIPSDIVMHYSYSVRYPYRIVGVRAENGSAEANIAQNGAYAIDGKVIFAAYENGVLSYVLTQDVQPGVVIFSDDRIDENIDYKVYVWNSFDSMVPLTE